MKHTLINQLYLSLLIATHLSSTIIPADDGPSVAASGLMKSRGLLVVRVSTHATLSVIQLILH